MKKILALLVVVGAIGAAYVFLYTPQLQAAKQKQTVSDVRNTGTAFMSWLTDQFGSTDGETQFAQGELRLVPATYSQSDLQLVPYGGTETYNLQLIANFPHLEGEDPPLVEFKISKSDGEVVSTKLRKLSFAAVHKQLHPTDDFYYLQVVPQYDGWGHELEFYISDSIFAASVFLIRSPGRDGEFSGTSYTAEGFPSKNLDEDIVWMDGYMIRWPVKS